MAFIDLVADGPADWYAHKYGENGQTIPSYIRQIKEWNSKLNNPKNKFYIHRIQS